MLQKKWKMEYQSANMQDKTLARHPMKDCSLWWWEGKVTEGRCLVMTHLQSRVIER